MRLLPLVLLLGGLGLSGCDFFRDSYDPSVRVTNMILAEAPLTRGNGDAWDDDGPADLIVEIQSVQGAAVAQSRVFSDVGALPADGLALDVALNVRTSDRYTILLLDADTDVYEELGMTEAFDYAMLDASDDGTVRLHNGDGSIEVVLELAQD